MNYKPIYNYVTNNYGTIYFGTVFLYNSYKTYKDSKKALIEYRNNKFTSNKINDEWSAVLYGANNNFSIRLVDSFIYIHILPFTFPFNLLNYCISWIVLKLNKN
jgi:hypothetical protein